MNLDKAILKFDNKNSLHFEDLIKALIENNGYKYAEVERGPAEKELELLQGC